MRGKVVYWTYVCDRCHGAETEAMSGDMIPDGGIVRDQATADKYMRRDGWVIRRGGETICPDCSVEVRL